MTSSWKWLGRSWLGGKSAAEVGRFGDDGIEV
jgi:hypothetical protein